MLLTNTPIPHGSLYGGECLHLSVTEIELCEQYQDAEWTAQIQAEQLAELAGERALENAGYWDAREQEYEEARRGVVSFEDAHAMALGYLDAADRRKWSGGNPDLTFEAFGTLNP